jgi:prolyl-tRNA synthetase
MKFSKLFTKTTKNVPADEQAKNAKLLIRAGYIDKQLAGVYSYLPLGKMVLDNIIQIIRDEMDSIGGNEISMTALQSSEPWVATGRWDEKNMDVWFKTKLASGSELGLAPTHEEPFTQMMRRFVDSYKDLPAYPYQFQIKFRNELRAKSGLMRGREFWMKDMYSFSRSQQEHDLFYNLVIKSYQEIFNKLGIGDITYKTFASGGSFSQFSDEFQTMSEVGEDTIYVSETKKIAINKDVLNDNSLKQLGLKLDELQEKKAVEVGNIFHLGTKYTKPLNLHFTDEDGVRKPVIMGSYGLGPSRLMGLLAEHFADEKGLAWPVSIAPFKVYLAQIGTEQAINELCQDIYDHLRRNHVKLLWDDRDERTGVKFADADLMGIPYRLVISQKTIKTGKYELKKRTQPDLLLADKDSVIKTLAL